MKDIGVIALSAALLYACSSADSKPPTAGSDLDAGPPSEAGPIVDAAKEDAADASDAADAADAGFVPMCPLADSQNLESPSCPSMGDASYSCDAGPVFGSLYRCSDVSGVPHKPPGMCAEIARNDATATTDYLCDRQACTYVADAACSNAATEYAMTCPAVVAIPSGCTLTSDAGAQPQYCCQK